LSLPPSDHGLPIGDLEVKTAVAPRAGVRRTPRRAKGRWKGRFPSNSLSWPSNRGVRNGGSSAGRALTSGSANAKKVAERRGRPRVAELRHPWYAGRERDDRRESGAGAPPRSLIALSPRPYPTIACRLLVCRAEVGSPRPRAPYPHPGVPLRAVRPPASTPGARPLPAVRAGVWEGQAPRRQ